MKTTIEFLDAAKAASGVPSDYALSKILGITHSAISKYRNGKDFFGDSTAIRVAELLKIDTGIVLAAVHAERSKTEKERAAWESILQKFGGVAASVLLAIGSATLPAPNAYAAGIDGPGQCILCKTRKRNKNGRWPGLFPK